MTIAAGFVCSDGLLFASDTLYVGSAQLADGPKFWVLDSFGETTVVFGGAGTVAGLKRTVDEIRATATPTKNRHNVITTIEDALAVVEAKLQPQEFEKTAALVGIRIGQEYWLYENVAAKLLLTVTDGNSQCVGAGQPLGNYFAASLFQSNMPIKWAKVVAAHLIRQVKKYNSGYCGGGTNMIVLPAVGEPEEFTWKDYKDYIESLEERLSGLDSVMQLVLPNEKLSDEAVLDGRLLRIKQTIRDVQRDFMVQLVGVGAVGFAGHVLTTAVASTVGVTEPVRQATKPKEKPAPKPPKRGR